MLKLSDLQTPKGVGVKQFCKEKYYIKHFCANGTFVPSANYFDNGKDFTLTVDEPILIDINDEDVSTEELSEFKGILDRMMEVGNTYSRMFSIPTEKIIAYKQFAVKIKDFIKDKTMPSRTIFLYRIRQVIAYINRTQPQKLSSTLPYAIQYLKEYVESYITQSINKGISSNIGMALGMNRFLPDRSTARALQRVLRKVVTELNGVGTINKMTQKRLQIAYRMLFANLIEGIESKVKDPLKRSMLDEVINGIKSSIDNTKNTNQDNKEQESA